MDQVFTITFSECVENHAGMQKIGQLASSGFTYQDLVHAKEWFEERGGVCEIHHLNQLYDGEPTENAYVLVARKGLNLLIDDGSADDFYREQTPLEKDTKALMRGRVVNKKARYNLCFADKGQEPDYENGKGRIIPFGDVPILNGVRNKLAEILKESLMAEGNYYYDVNKCYISYHGDGERKRVVGIRTGRDWPLHYQWFLRSEPVGKRLELVLGHGDVYIMSQKAVGTDWLKKVIPTLRHAAGYASVLKLEGPVIKSCKIVYALDDDGCAEIKPQH